MKRFVLCCLTVTVGLVSSLRADETIRAVQSRLKTGGFYFGEINGRNDSRTSAAITRYQIRNGLQITGKLDAPTRRALGVTAGNEPEILPRGFGEEAWRSLRKSDQEYLDRLVADEAQASPPKSSPVAKVTSVPPAPKSTASKERPTSTASTNSNRERIRDYVAAFILAGLDPEVGSEAEFFADRVNYFGEKNVPRDRIRRDLQRYDSRWPQRGFWLAGELEVSSLNDKLKVSFPLRYELQNASKHSAGTVSKTLILEKSGAHDFQIVAVDVRKVMSR
jgi:hypothetical protein